MISCCFLERSCYVITFLCWFFLVFLMLLWLCPFLKNQNVFGLGLFYDFFVFYYFVLRLYNSLQKNELSSFSWVDPVWVPWGFFLVMLLFYNYCV